MCVFVWVYVCCVCEGVCLVMSMLYVCVSEFLSFVCCYVCMFVRVCVLCVCCLCVCP